MKPRLLIIHNRLVVGGPALDMIPLAYHLKDEFDIHILYGEKEDDEVEPVYLLEKYKGLTLVNVRSLRRSVNFLNDIRSYLYISKYIRKFRPHIVHTHGAKAGIFGRVAASIAKAPLVIHTFHGHLFHSYFNRFFTSLYIALERVLAKKTHIIIAISESQESDIRKTLKVGFDKVKTIPLGVDYINFSKALQYRQAFKRTYKIEENEICIGIFGRMVAIKNPMFFIKVAEYILKDPTNTDLRFFVIGDGTETISMKRYLKERGISFASNNDAAPVVFTSWVQNIQNVLEGLDIVVLTSFNEGTPLSVIEAQLCGKPVVAVNVGGVKDTMRNNETGFIINSHSVAEFSEAILKLARDIELRRLMGKAGIEFASKKFSKEKEIENMRNIYLSYKQNNIAAL